MKKVLFIALLVAVTTQAGAQPLGKIGDSCPTGYRIESGYCVPMSGYENSGSIQKHGSRCPGGYMIHGDYCTPMSGYEERGAIGRSGEGCPSGYLIEGNYCTPYQKRR